MQKCFALSFVAGAVMFAAARSATAQSASQCDASIAFVADRALPDARTGNWTAWRALATCGASGVSAFATAVSSTRVLSETDVTRITTLFAVFDGRREQALFDVYLAAIGNGAASESYRIGAMRALAGTVEPEIEIQLPPLNSGKQYCGTMSRQGTTPGIPSELPSDATDRIVTAMAGVVMSDAKPRVRLAAKCWQNLLERNAGVDIRKISVTYVCENRFQIRNGNTATVGLRYVVGEKLDQGEFSVNGKSSYALDVDGIGTVRIYLGQSLISARTNDGKDCR